MKHLILVLTATLLAATPSPAEDGLHVRYTDPSGPMSLTVSHDSLAPASGISRLD